MSPKTGHLLEPRREGGAITTYLDGRPLDRRRFVQSVAGVLVVTSFGGALAGCGDDDEDASGTGAGSEGKVGGKLAMLNWSGYEDREVSSTFRQKNDVSVESSPLNSNEEILTKLKAGGLGSIDLATPNLAYVAGLQQAQVLASLDYSRLPNTKRYLDQIKAVAEANATFGGETYAAPFIWGYDALNYNSSEVTDPPASWKDLMDSSFKDRLLLVDSATANFWIWPRVLGFDPETLTSDQLDETTDFLIRLKETQVRTVTGNHDDIVAQLSAGEVVATASGSWSAVPYFANEKGGDRVKSTIPKEGGYTWIDSWALAADAPNRDTAYAWIDFMLGTKQQAALADSLASATVNADAVSDVSAEFREIYPYDSPDLASANLPNTGFPKPDGDYVTIQDMSDAWARVIAG